MNFLEGIPLREKIIPNWGYQWDATLSYRSHSMGREYRARGLLLRAGLSCPPQTKPTVLNTSWLSATELPSVQTWKHMLV